MNDYSELIVKADDDQYFEDAKEDEEVYGKMTRYVEDKMVDVYVFVQLGKRVPKRRRNNERPGMAKEKKFIGCYMETYKTEKDLEDGINIQGRFQSCTILLQR